MSRRSWSSFANSSSATNVCYSSTPGTNGPRATHLEPDQKFGHRWLEAIRNALMVKSLA